MNHRVSSPAESRTFATRLECETPPELVFKNNFKSKFKIMTWCNVARLPPQS